MSIPTVLSLSSHVMSIPTVLPLFPVLLVQVVVRSRDFRRQSRNYAVREYFYGKEPRNLFPFSFDVPFAEVTIFKIGGTIL